MLIKLTGVNKTNFYLHASLVRSVGRHPQNLLETIVETTLMSSQGYLTYVVLENPGEVAELVNSAILRTSPTAH